MEFDWSQASNDMPPDLLERAKYARFLTHYLASKGKEENYVLNVNAIWGAGKTWFLRRWADEIKHSYPVVFIDSWKSDHSKDPFLSVVSAISKDLESLVDARFKDSAITKKSWLLLKGVAPEITKGIVKKYLNINDDVFGELIGKDDVSTLSDLGGKAVEKLIKIHDETNSTIDEFKKAIAVFLSLIEQKSNKEMPLFVFVDELDRCRPTYAIEMLETIKHIFDIKKVVFIIATDKGQLQHSIKAVYGEGFDSQRYLDRFFNRSVTLRQFSLREFISFKVNESKVFYDYCNDFDNFWFQCTNSDYVDDVINILTYAADSVGMDLRTSSYWFDRLEAIIIDGCKRIDIVFMSFIMAIYSSNQSTYSDFINGEFSKGSDITDFCNKNLKISKENKIQIKSSDGLLRKAINVESSMQHYIKSSDFNDSYMSMIFGMRRLLNTALNDEVLNNLRLAARNKFYKTNSSHISSSMIFIGIDTSIGSEFELIISDFYYRNKLSFIDFCDYSELATILE
ncbi:Predicted P-loop ATPase [Serratia quinivorans]|uniref:KAP family P-loop NTPase fold protein n=1 Tax=Serratia quinivorans TaxID=137545 RepID=UPI00217B56A5|nr:KAP family NTPase [Serratia quinivorans]CAI1619303.1 Predicted P-loop ATPase [Serratia quinivorans]CAI2395306.1 Predicted P-loop ATPase [Serratia quinivorans]